MADSAGEADDFEQLDRFLTRPGPPLRLGVVRVDDPRMIPRFVRELSDRHCISMLQLGREDDRVDLVEHMRAAMRCSWLGSNNCCLMNSGLPASHGVNLRDVDLHANLRCGLVRRELSNTDLRNANLYKATLRWASLHEADFAGRRPR